MYSFRRFLTASLFVAALAATASAANADSFDRLPGQIENVADCDSSAEVVVGDADFSGVVRAYRWSAAGGLEVVGTRGEESYGYAVSDDGDTVVGSFIKNGETSAFVWRKAVGCVDIGDLGGGFARANDVSAGGNVIVGTSTDEEGRRRAFRATFQQSLDGNLKNLGTLGGQNSEGLFVSADGQVVVGKSQVAGGDWHLFYWTQNLGMLDLGSLGGADIFPLDISDDGSVIVGDAQTGQGDVVPFLAKKAVEAKRIQGIGNVLGSAEVVTGDGRFVLGQAQLLGISARQTFRYRIANAFVEPLGSLFSTRSAFVSSADGDGEVVGGYSIDSKGRSVAFLIAPTMESGQPVSVDALLNKVFENDTLPKLRFSDVPCVSANGKAFVAKGWVKGSGRPAFVRAEIDRYPAVVEESYFETRPYQAEIATYVSLASTYTSNLYFTYGPIPAIYYAYLYAEYARQYQAVCASLTLDGIDDAGTAATYLEYRSVATQYSYYAYENAFYHVYVATGGDADYSTEAAYYSYYAYYYQQFDLDDLTATE